MEHEKKLRIRSAEPLFAMSGKAKRRRKLVVLAFLESNQRLPPSGSASAAAFLVRALVEIASR
jgi:hypothetical protein